MDTLQYKCPNCGAELQYKADRQKFGCDYCLSEYTEEEIKTVCSEQENTDLSQNVDEAAEAEFTGGNLYVCNTCGAEIMSDQNTAATFCVYCHSPVILKGRLSGEYKPNCVLPFEIGKDKALEIFKEKMGKKKFIPSDFMASQTLEKMTGLYVPFWLAGCNVNASMSATGKHIKSWTSGNYRYCETREYAVERDARITFDGVPADGASKIEDSLMDAIEPFDYSKMKPFSMSYLSGFLADRYDVDKGAVFPRIREKVDKATRDILQSTIEGYSEVDVTGFRNNIMSTKWSYSLLPLWFMTYNYYGKTYEYAINGQTGNMAGIPPLSNKKLFALGAAIVLIGTVLAGLGGYLFS